MTYDVGNPGPGLGQVQECGGVEPVNLDVNHPTLNLISNGNIDLS